MKKSMHYITTMVFGLYTLPLLAAPENPLDPALLGSITVILPQDTVKDFEAKLGLDELKAKYKCEDVIKNPVQEQPGQTPDTKKVDDNRAFPTHLNPTDSGSELGRSFTGLVYRCTIVNKDLYAHFSKTALDLANGSAAPHFVRLLIDTDKHPISNCPIRKCSSDGLYHHSGAAGIPPCGYCQ